MKNTQKNTSSKDTLAIDFDGVLADYKKGWYNLNIWGKPKKHAKTTIKRLMKRYNIVIYTCRDANGVYQWLDEWDFPKIPVATTKPGAIAYIDDRAVRFTNWINISRRYLSNDYN